MAIYSVQIKCCTGITCPNSDLSVDIFVHIAYYIDPITACAIRQGRCKDDFCQITKCFLLHTYFVQKGHYINDTSRRLKDHISWWNLFYQMPCQSRFVGFLIGKWTWQYPNKCFSSALHLICFYKNLPLCGFHPTAHLYITECFTFLLRYPIMEYQGWFFCICFVFPKWPADISLCLDMYEVISNIFRCSRCNEGTD